MNMRSIQGILLLYHVPCSGPVAETIVDNYSAFRQYSRFPVWEVNTEYGFPQELARLSFDVIILHYSLFGRGYSYELDDAYLNYLHTARRSHLIAFFQDEYRYCDKRFRFINEFNVDTVYTCLEPRFFDQVYGRHTSARHIHDCLPGYVSENLIHAADTNYRPMEDRTIDIGYRARKLDYYMGAGAQEKHTIGIDFTQQVRRGNIPLRLDIATDEANRLYGKDWTYFLSNCKGTLGVESGVSIFDLTDEVRLACEELTAANPAITFDEVYSKVLEPWENNIFLRTISPRHFEAAAFRVCQILFDGQYSKIMLPHIHYIPLRKDLSNFDDAISSFTNPAIRQEIVERAYADLIASPAYTYQSFICEFDNRLTRLGMVPGRQQDTVTIQQIIDRDLRPRRLKTWLRKSIYMNFPGRSRLRTILHRYIRRV